MGKKKQCKVMLVPLLEFPSALIEEFDENRIKLLKKEGIWEYLQFVWPPPDMQLVTDVVVTSNYGQMKEVVL